MKKFPNASVILLVILLIAAAVTWFLPAVSFETVYDETLGYNVIDLATVTVSSNNRIYPWELPGILIRGVDSVLSTLILICVCNGAFGVMNASGMFPDLIRRLCRRFQGRQSHLLIFVFTGFVCLGLVVVPHCFIPFVPLVIALALQLGYDPLVGLAMVLFGATTASMAGPVSAVTAMCQESVGLPVYSGAGVRFILLVVFHLVTALYLLRYARRVKADPKNSYLYGYGYCPPNAADLSESAGAAPLNLRHIFALAGFVGTFCLIILGSTALGFSTDDISSVFLIYALCVGPMLGFRFTDTLRYFGEGIQNSVSTIIVISFAGAVTLVLRQGGIFDTLLYYTSFAFSRLPGFLVPAGLLALVSLFNCVLPSGPAKGVMLMPLLGPAAQMSGMSMQNSVLTYNLGDSFTNYLLPYDATTASYLETANIPFHIWVRFTLKLYFMWNVVGIAATTLLYYVGYGPF